MLAHDWVMYGLTNPPSTTALGRSSIARRGHVSTWTRQLGARVGPKAP